MSPIVGQVALVIYALLLGVGGVLGYVKAGSRSSLIAGLGTAAAAIMSVVISAYLPILGLWLGAVLSMLMLALFAARFLRTRNFMPSGLLLVTSLVMTVLLIVLVSQPRVGG